MTRVDRWRTLLHGVVLLVPVAMGSCAYRIHKLPHYDYRVEDPAARIVFLQTLPLLLVLGLVIYAIGQHMDAIEAERLATERANWEGKHSHTWNGCRCVDQKCGATRHEFDNECTCKNCSETIHTPDGWSVTGNFGSSAIESATCTRCGQEMISSYYAG